MLLLKDCSFKYYHIYFSHLKGYYIYYIHHYPYNIYQLCQNEKEEESL
jgi:hypothetical protein